MTRDENDTSVQKLIEVHVNTSKKLTRILCLIKKKKKLKIKKKRKRKKKRGGGSSHPFRQNEGN
jgi:hypothetical protein